MLENKRFLYYEINLCIRESPYQKHAMLNKIEHLHGIKWGIGTQLSINENK